MHTRFFQLQVFDQFARSFAGWILYVLLKASKWPWIDWLVLVCARVWFFAHLQPSKLWFTQTSLPFVFEWVGQLGMGGRGSTSYGVGWRRVVGENLTWTTEREFCGRLTLGTVLFHLSSRQCDQLHQGTCSLPISLLLSRSPNRR